MLYIVTHLNISFPSYFVAGFAKTTYLYARANYRAAYVRYINDKDLRRRDLKMLSLYSFLWTVMDESVKGKTDKINPASGRDPKTLCQMCVGRRVFTSAKGRCVRNMNSDVIQFVGQLLAAFQVYLEFGNNSLRPSCRSPVAGSLRLDVWFCMVCASRQANKLLL